MRRALVWTSLGLAALLAMALPALLPTFTLQLVIRGLYLGGVAMTFILLAGFGNMISLVQMSFAAVAGYMIAIGTDEARPVAWRRRAACGGRRHGPRRAVRPRRHPGAENLFPHDDARARSALLWGWDAMGERDGRKLRIYRPDAPDDSIGFSLSIPGRSITSRSSSPHSPTWR